MILKDKIVMVTGGAQGIGRGIVEKMVTEGAWPVILDVNEAAGADCEKTLLRNGRKATWFLKTDCTKTESVTRSVQAIVQELKKIDVLVNNIGWCADSFFAEEDEAYWNKVIDLTLKAPLIVTQACLKEMEKTPGGKIINIASDAGRVGQLRGTVYAACKGGVIAFTKSLAREVARSQISVNCVCPGPTETSLYQSCIPDKIKEQFSKIIPFRRIGQPQDIAEAVAFFASDSANYITGQVLSVSGGLTMAG